MAAQSLVAVLQQYGVHVRDMRVKPRPGAFTPVGVLNHHTATKGSALASCCRGRPDLSGPLCNVNIARDGTVHVVSDGRSNNAGKGSTVVIRDLQADRPVTADAKARKLADDADGNRYFIGIEVDNDGVGEPYSPAQLASLGMVNAALCLHFEWSANRAIHHRQWTARKIDMSWPGDLTGLTRWWMGALSKNKAA